MEQTLEPLRTRAFSVWQYILLVRIIFTISKQMLHAVRCRDFRGSIQMRITQCRLKGRVTEIHLNFLQGIALMQQQCCTGVPLRYNYDKPDRFQNVTATETHTLHRIVDTTDHGGAGVVGI